MILDSGLLFLGHPVKFTAHEWHVHRGPFLGTRSNFSTPNCLFTV